MNTGVYCILNTRNGKRYVGSTALSFSRRWKKHCQDLRAKRHKNRHLQAAWQHYGAEAFQFAVLESCLPGDCIVREQHWLDFHKAADRQFGYNASPTAQNCLGIKRSAETRAKVSAALRGKKLSPEHRAKLSAVRLGKKIPALQGRKLSPEHRAKVAAANRGKTLSPETRAKVGAANRLKLKGRKLSEEHRRNVVAATRLRGMSAENHAKTVESRIRKRAEAFALLLEEISRLGADKARLIRKTLTNRHLQVARLTAAGCRDGGIARILTTTVKAVKALRHRLRAAVVGLRHARVSSV
jgi:group I intron endonuclease